MDQELTRLRQALTDAADEHRQAVALVSEAKKAADIAAMVRATKAADLEAYRKQRHEELDRQMDEVT